MGQTPLPAESAASDVFDGWSVADGGGATRFLASDVHRSGTTSLLVSRPDGDAPSGVPTISQQMTVAQDSEVRVELWARSDGSTVDGAVEVRVGDQDPATIAVPAGTFDWQPFSLSWTVPPGVRTATLAVLVPGSTAGTRIDDVVVRGQGSRGVVVRGGGFEEHSADLHISDRSLVLRPDSTLHLVTRRSPSGTLRWTLQEYTGGAPLRGTARFADHRAVLHLTGVPPGYYALTVRSDVGGVPRTRRTSLVVAPPPPAAATSPILGVGVHLGGEDDGSLAAKVADLAALGLRAARTDADWSTIEQQEGRYEFAGLDRVVAALRNGGLRPLLIADYRNALYDGGRTPSTPAGIAGYARFAAAVAARYPDADLEVYNEFDFRFNDGACGPTPDCYLELLRPTATAVRAANAAGTIAGPAIAGLGVQQAWLQGFLDGGGLDSVDAVSFHPYVQPERPDVLDGQLDTLAAALESAGAAATPVWFTEFGVATVPGWATERQQAEDVARVVGVAAAHGVDRVYWYDAIDDGPNRLDNEHNFGLFRTPTSFAPGALVPKPAAGVMAAVARFAAGGTATGAAHPGGDVRMVRVGDASLAWSVAAPVRVVAGGRTAVHSMTGRALGALTRLGSPVWLSGQAPLRLAAEAR